MVKRFAFVSVLVLLFVVCMLTIQIISAASAESGRSPTPTTAPSNSSAQTPVPSQEPTTLSDPQHPTPSSMDFAAVAIGVSAAVLTVGLIFYVFRRNSKGWK